MRFTLAAIGLAVATLSFAAPAAAAPSPAPAEQARTAASPAPVPVPSRGVSRPVPDGAPETGGGLPVGVPLGGALLVAGAATGLVAVRRRSAA